MIFTPGQKLTAADLNNLANLAKGSLIPTNDRQFTHTPSGTLEQKFDKFYGYQPNLPQPFDIRTIPYTKDGWKTHRKAIWIYINHVFDKPDFLTYNGVIPDAIGSLKFENSGKNVVFKQYDYDGYSEGQFNPDEKILRSNGEGWIYSGIDVEDIDIKSSESVSQGCKLYGTFIGLKSKSGGTDSVRKVMFLLITDQIYSHIRLLQEQEQFVVGWLQSVIGDVTIRDVSDLQVSGIELNSFFTIAQTVYDATHLGLDDGLIYNYFSKYRSSIDYTHHHNIPWEIDFLTLKIFRPEARIGNRTVSLTSDEKPEVSAYIGENWCVADLSACTIELSDQYVEDYTHSSIKIADIRKTGEIDYYNISPTFPCWEFYSNADISAPAY